MKVKYLHSSVIQSGADVVLHLRERWGGGLRLTSSGATFL